MVIITVAHQKGGVGKTTLTLNLAYCLADSLKVAIADTDPQGSITDLGTLLTGIQVIDLESALTRKADGIDVVLIDTPPYLTSRLTDLFAVSDYVLIPTKAGILDALAIRATVSLLKQTMATRPQLKAGIVLSMVQPQSVASDEVRDMLSVHQIPLHQTAITQRVSYSRSPLTAGVFGSSDQKAKAEVEALAAEIIEALQS